MTRYLISFPSGAMDDIPDQELPAVGEAAHAVVQEAMDEACGVFDGGLAEDVDPVMVAADRRGEGRPAGRSAGRAGLPRPYRQ